ncbi:MAG TPA: phosphoribosylglycinamide synthetase C domain-containing protein [bacterium]|nr:phosphoribosylglycinamide synthetase C domain-containing protein [bacterium]
MAAHSDMALAGDFNVANGSLGSLPALSWHPGASATVVLASGGYPGSYRRGLPITGLDAVDPAVTVFHAGTARDPNGRLIAIGGRVLMVTARGDTLAEATARATDNAARISWENSFFRRDIGHRDLRRP